MEEVFSKVVAIILGCILLFIVPVKIVTERQKNMQQTYIMTETICFVDSVCNKGILYSDAYLNYVNKISQDNNIYRIKLQHIKKSNDNEIELNEYTNQIILALENQNSYEFSIGDLFRVEVIDKDNNSVTFYGGCIKDEDY